MNPLPVHCGKPAEAYWKQWPSDWPRPVRRKAQPCYETGYRCRICGQIRLPATLPAGFDPAARETELDALRLAGIAFDEELKGD